MQYTENYHLKKPEDHETAEIQDLNDNADAIDAAILNTATNAVQTNLAAHNTSENPHANVGWAKVADIPAAIPVGVILLWSGAVDSIPVGWALCDGTRGTPDLRGRFVVGAGQAYAVGNKGGLDSVTLTTAQMPVHRHDLAYRRVANGPLRHFVNETHTDGSYGGTFGDGINNALINNSGGNQAHENRPPYYALCYIMYLGG